MPDNNGISGTNDNKTINARKEDLKFLVLTNSVQPTTTVETLIALYNNGNSRSVHYLIDKEGFQNQFADDNEQTFTSGRSQFRGNVSLNQRRDMESTKCEVKEPAIGVR